MVPRIQVATECFSCSPPHLNSPKLIPLLSIQSVSFHQSSILSSYTSCSYQKDKRATPGNLPRSNTLSEIRQHLIEKYFHLVCNGLISTPECEWLALRPGCFIASNQRLGADAARHLQQLPQQFRR